MSQGARSKATEAIKAVASAIRWDRHLECLDLQMEYGFTDEAGVALAEALTTINKTLRRITLSKATFGARVYDAFSAMLRVNTSLLLMHPRLESAGVDGWLLESYTQTRIEHRLNRVGRGRLLASRQTTREEWVDAVSELNSYCDIDEIPEFNVGCLYSLLRLNPAICMLELDCTSNSGE
jgi:hypothetical protein